MRVLFKILRTLLGVIIALIGVAVVAGAILVRRPFPKVDGIVRVPGLDDRVEVYRDERGIPHIYARTDHDLFMAQGYVHAQDRLWQLEFNRRIAPGRLSEVLGEAALENDRFLRTLGMGRAAQAEADQLDGEPRAFLEAYAAGVNAYVGEGHALPLEFTLLGIKPGPWRPVDSVGWGKVMAWSLANNRDQELLRMDLAARLGEERMRELTPPYPPEAPLILAQAVDYRALSVHLLHPGALLKQWMGQGAIGLGSNNWVVSGAHATTGKPLLANDPHLGIQMPSIWYEIGLHCVELNDRCHYQTVGASFPGAPGVIIGHNPWIAWGVTTLPSDTQDLYIEKVNPNNPNQVEFQGQWEDVQVIREEILVKGRDNPEALQVRVTRHGPILSDVMEGATEVLALRWVALDDSPLIQAVFELGRARNWEEFRAALSNWSIAPQNFVYADVEGNIGYQATGRVPIRAKGNGVVPVPGWTGEYEWTGTVPFEEMPARFNPPEGYLATANNRIVGDDYPYLLGVDWDNGYRARRIGELLTAKPALSPEDFEAIQADTLAIPGREITPYLLAAGPAGGRAQIVVERLKSWDYRCDWDSTGCAAFQAVLAALLRGTYADELGEELAGPYLESEWAVPLLIELLAEPVSPWFDDVTTADRVETRDEILARALEQAAVDLEERLGSNAGRWQWGALHTAVFGHVMGGVKPLDLIFNRSIPGGGTGDTVYATWFSLAEPFAVQSVPSYRQILSLADWSASRSMHSTGQSGLPFHRHYTDMIQDWRDVRYHPMLWSDAEVQQHAKAKLILEP